MRVGSLSQPQSESRRTRVDARRVFKVEKVGVVIGSECEEVVAMLVAAARPGRWGQHEIVAPYSEDSKSKRTGRSREASCLRRIRQRVRQQGEISGSSRPSTR